MIFLPLITSLLVIFSLTYLYVVIILPSIVEMVYRLAVLIIFYYQKPGLLCYLICIQAALLRSISDHCLIILTIDEQNWGPKLLRMLKCWEDIPMYVDFVKEKC